jgi:hypothetical protein
MIVSAALSLMLTLGAELVPPDGCAVVAAWPDGRAVAECVDGATWFVYDPDLIRGGLWSKTSFEPPELAPVREQSHKLETDRRGT